MNRKKVIFIFVIFVLLVGYSILLSNILTTPLTVTGTINTDTLLKTDDGKVYQITPSNNVAALLNHIGKKVEVTGIIDDADGENKITVNSFTVLTEAPEGEK